MCSSVVGGNDPSVAGIEANTLLVGSGGSLIGGNRGKNDHDVATGIHVHLPFEFLRAGV